MSDVELERQKWDKYYASMPSFEEDALTKKFGQEFAECILKILPKGGSILEAGCGAGWQSLALARLGTYNVDVMDFSAEALKHAKRLFARENLRANFIQENVLVAGNPTYDIVFNAGVLEHYAFEQQVAFLRGMASRSRKYVLVAVPNPSCYWYWLWRLQKSARTEWSFGKVPSLGLSGIFTAAGLTFRGEKYLGEAWTEAFISGLIGLDDELRKEILNIHRSGFVPKADMGYLVAAVGSVKGVSTALPGWETSIQEEKKQESERLAALADAVALKIQAERKLLCLQNQNEALSRDLEEQKQKLQQETEAKEWQLQEKQQVLDTINVMARRVLPQFVRTWANRTITHEILARRRHTHREQTEMVENSQEQVSLVALPAKYDVLFFPIIDLDFPYVQRPQQLIRHFLREGHRVFYLKTDFILDASLRKPVVKEIEKNTYQVELFSAKPVNLYTDEIHETLVSSFRSQLEWLQEKYDIVDAVCLVELPFWTPLVTELRSSYGWKVVYDCLDYVAGFSNVSEKVVSQENKLIASANLVVASSTTLYSLASRNARRSILIKNGCDYEKFSQSTEGSQDIRELRTPIIGYYGLIADWFDVELVVNAAEAHPDKSFVIIGRVLGANVTRLKELGNVYLLGSRPHDALPSYLASFDVCIIPFKKTRPTAATDPVKFYEMLAAGKPIVTMDLPELEGIKELVYASDNPSDFISRIDNALLEEEGDPIRKKRQMYASTNTWAQRFKILETEINSLFDHASIVIVSHNNRELTRACLNSIFDNTTYPSFEVIVEDNGSTDGTAEMLTDEMRKRSSLTVHINRQNNGFPDAVNSALKTSKGRYLFVLNNDVVVTRGTFSRLIRHMDEDRTIGLICPLTNNAANEASLKLSMRYPNDRVAISDLARKIAREGRGSRFPVKTVPLFLGGTVRDVLDHVGLVDERFRLGMFEDDDWSYRMRNHGYTTVCAEDVFVFHVGKASFMSLGETEYRRVFNANKKRYESKWGTTWIPYSSDPATARHSIKAAVNELQSLLREYQGRQVVIFPPTINTTTLSQRSQSLAAELAKNGFLVFKCGKDIGKPGFEKVSFALYESNIPHETYMEINRPIVFATCHSRQYLQYYRRPIIVYDNLDSGKTKANGVRILKIQQQWLSTHADVLLSDADTVTTITERLSNVKLLESDRHAM